MKAMVTLDTDFDGARFRAACARHGGGKLHYIALAPRPVDASQLPEPWRSLWPPCVPGQHRMASSDGLVVLDVLIGDPDACLAQLSARVDEAYLAWVPASMPVLARLMADGARLHAVQLDDAQRLALQGSGFLFDDSPLRAVFHARHDAHAAPVAPQRCAVVIGAGVAGAAACERLAARGWKVTLVERHAQPASEASGNLAGIFMPLMSKDDNIATRLVRAAYLYSLSRWKDLGGIGAAIEGSQSGVLHLARDGAHAQVQRQIAASGLYPREFARIQAAGWKRPRRAPCWARRHPTAPGGSNRAAGRARLPSARPCWTPAAPCSRGALPAAPCAWSVATASGWCAMPKTP